MNEEKMNVGQNRFLRHKKLTLFVFILVCMILVDFTVGYIFLDHPIEQPARISNPYFNHTLKPFFDGLESWGVGLNRLVANDLGFKDRTTRTVPLATDKHRIVFIGDSFTEGIGITHEETFVGLIGSALGLDKYEVLNAGLSSYAPRIYYLKMKYFLEQGLKFNELVVFVDLSDTQDELAYKDWATTTPDSWRTFKEKITHKIDFFLEHHSQLYLHGLRPLLLGEDKRKLRALFFGGGRMTAEEEKYIYDRGRWTLDDNVWNDWGKEGVAHELDNMEKLNELCRAYNVKMSVAVYPWPVTISNKDLHSRQVEIWQKFTDEKKIDLYNFFPVFIATTTESSKVISTYYIPNDNHWNSEGHKLIAQYWLKQYLKNK